MNDKANKKFVYVADNRLIRCNPNFIPSFAVYNCKFCKKEGVTDFHFNNKNLCKKREEKSLNTIII